MWPEMNQKWLDVTENLQKDIVNKLEVTGNGPAVNRKWPMIDQKCPHMMDMYAILQCCQTYISKESLGS